MSLVITLQDLILVMEKLRVYGLTLKFKDDEHNLDNIQ